MNIRVILIQTHEAHSSAWPLGLENQPEPQGTFQERVQRAQQFMAEEKPPYDVYVDGWDDAYEQRFRAWPDKYYFVDEQMRVLEKSEYGARADALVDYDCLTLCRDILSGRRQLPGIELDALPKDELLLEEEEEGEVAALEAMSCGIPRV